MAQNLKQKAKKKYSIANYIQAIELYNEAMSIQTDAKKKSILQMNIALCFYNLNLIQEYHTHLKLSLNYDQFNQKPKLHTIKYHILKGQLQIAKKQLAQYKFSQNFQNQMLKIRQMMIRKQISLTKGYEKSQNWIQVFTDLKIQFQHFSESLQVRKSKYGLGIFAKQDIPAWKIIIVEKPLVLLTKIEQGYNNDVAMMMMKIKKLMKLSKQFTQKFKTLSHKSNLNFNLEERRKVQKINDFQMKEMIKTNWFQLEQLKQEAIGDNKYSIGSALYQKISIMNHACQKSCDNFFIGQTMFVRTIKPIQKNSEIFISYFNDKEQPQRRLKLQSGWKIKCDCIYCQEQRKADNGLMDLNKRNSFKSNQMKKYFIGADIFFNGFQPHNKKYVLENPEFRWLFLLKLKGQNKLKGQMMARMFDSQTRQKQFQKMFECQEENESQMLKMLKKVKLS